MLFISLSTSAIGAIKKTSRNDAQNRMELRKEHVHQFKKKEDEIGSNVVVRKILQCHCYIVLCCTQHSNGNNIKHLFKYSPNIKEIECNKIESMLPEKQ